MIRILHVVSVMDVAGMESYIMNMYRQIDRSRFQFDFLVHHKRRGAFEDEIEALGGRVHHMTVLDDFNLIKYIRDLRALYKAHPEYRIVHGHLGSMAYWYLGEAKRCGVPWRILHSHVPGHMNTLKGYVKHMLFYLSPLYANIRYACSKEAGEYQFKNSAFTVIPNGVDTARFRYSAARREAAREAMNLQGRFVVGHVGRFTGEKNHPYMLSILAELRKTVPNAVLMLVGQGPRMQEIRELTKTMGLEDAVMFMGLQKDTPPFYQAMDAFFMPSLYEGLPLAAIEAQCAGLPCLLTETASPETAISPLTAYLPIGEENVRRWAQTLEAVYTNPTDRNGLIVNSDAYDSSAGTQRMAETYLKLLESQP